LWGKNYEDYFKEAYRILKRNGFLIIVEPKDKLKDGEHFNSQNAFINKVEEANFMQLGKAEERGKFVYFQFFKQ
jgi:ubiquinone/menaquinone biosynthesis C-methylase UbiE